MKKLKKLLSIVLAVAMVMSLAVSVTATGTSTITINNCAGEGESYSAYLIFNATSNTDGGVSYTISTSNHFCSAIYNAATEYEGTLKKYLSLKESASDSNVYVVEYLGSDGDDADFLTALKKIIKDNLSEATAVATVTSTETTTGSGEYTAEFTSLDEGYYYITTTVGSMVVLDTASNVGIDDKNVEPTVEKGVSETKEGTYDYGESATYGDSDAAIGDTVYFETTIKNVQNQTKLVLHDEMTNGLTFDSSSVSVELYYKAKETDANYTKVELENGVHYVLTYSGGSSQPCDDCDFEIDFEKLLTGADYASYINAYDTYIVVTYDAEVNSNAVIYDSTATSNSNDNTTYVSYGNASTTEVDETKTYVYEVELYKYTLGTGSLSGGNLSGETSLANAKFNILDSNGKTAVFTKSGNTYTLVKFVEATGYTLGNNETYEITSVTDSAVTIKGLDAETLYTIHETAAPSGYNLATTDTTFYIVGSDDEKQGTVYTDSSKETVLTVTADSLTNNPSVIAIENKTGSELPETGGIGVTIFYVVGGILILAAAGVIVINRKKIKK